MASRLVRAALPLLALFALLLAGQEGGVSGACVVTVAVATVDSKATPSGPLQAVLVTGAAPGSTGGGQATAATRCVYFWLGDTQAHSYDATYKGGEWPYIRLPDPNCTVVAPPELQNNITVAPPPSNILRINGLPLYQWTGEQSSDQCHCNVPKEGWSSVTPQGAGAAFPTTPVDVPPQAKAQSQIVTSLPPGVVASPPSSSGGDNSERNTLRVHGRLMIIAWACLLPLGAAFGRLIQAPPLALPAKGRFLTHAALQTSGVAVAAASFGLVIRKLNDSLSTIADIPYKHGRVGITAMALLFAQFLLGLVHPRPGVTHARVAWEHAHAILGRAALSIGIVNVFTGLFLAKDFSVISSDEFNVWAGWSAASVAFIWVLGAVVLKAADQKERSRAASLVGSEPAVPSDDDKAGLGWKGTSSRVAP